MKQVLIGLAMVILLAAAGCTATLKNINDSPILTGSEKRATLAEIQKAIERAGDSTLWQTQAVSPGHIVATRTWKVHMAQVDIKYSTDSYRITYKNSSDSLEYDGTQIHKSYNTYVEQLDMAINRELALL